MADSPRLPGPQGWPGLPTPFYQWMRMADATIATAATLTVSNAAIEARVTALENGSAGGVTSFKGRSGAVVPLIGDYSAWFQPASDTLDVFAATDLTAFADGDFPAWDATTETFVATTAPTGAVPYFIASGDTYAVPEYTQALFSMPIDCEGFLDVSGYLIGVD